MLRAALLLLVLLSDQIRGLNEMPEGQKYEVVFPRKLHAHHKRDTQQSEYPDLVQYGLEVNGQPMVLHLEKTEDLISENYTETYYLKDGSPVTTSPEIKDHCFYQGYVTNDNGSQVSLSACNGLSGIIATQENKFLIQPLKMSETGAHAVYQYEAQEQPKTCGVDDTSVNETIMTKLDFSTTSNEKQAFLKSRKYIQLYMVADNSMYNRFNRRNGEIRQRIFSIVNFVNQVYKPLNLFVALTGLEIWGNGNLFEVVTSADTNLRRFSEWREKKLLPIKPHDNAQFLTNIDFDGSTVGLAWIGTLCSNTNSAGVVQDHSEEYAPVAATLAHELGHNLGMSHDDNCCPATLSCIMAPSLSHNTPRTFSSCSQQDYQKFILEHMPVCMKDKPKMEEIQSTPVCGNKFTERGEECDCGSVQECTDKCCDAATCKLKQGAQCAEGECCSDCKLKYAGFVCRPAKDDCDLSDMCDGKSATCPSDGFRMNGSPCKNGEGYCYNGKCPTLSSQCETYWGAGALAAPNSCYETSRRYCPQSRYGQCGVLYCSRGSSQPIIKNFGYCSISQCKTLNPEVLVETGTKCGDERMCINGQCSAVLMPSRPADSNCATKCPEHLMCINGRCTAIPTPSQPADSNCATKCPEHLMCINGQCTEIPMSLRPGECDAKCPGHSVCNNLLECQCDEGWAPPDCDTRPNTRSSSTIVLAVLIPIVILILIMVGLWFYKTCQTKKKKRSPEDGSGVTNPTFNIQNKIPQQPTSYQNPQQYPGRPIYPPQPPAQYQKPQQYPGRPMYPPQPPAQYQKPQKPAAAPSSRPMYPPMPPQAAKPNYRR
ncbi:zinc metalloproteinase-disintegrin-like MTP4 isoform X1 [Bufo gargarizans]|uniref:zinc metalloproteinase-disintegrin-like MTP4 isoform X1 n=1 Tax=Bufo gargarizans TaxID=30331 RepID=UPI001CF3E144|nr:zinc metalloproteinase-disintegrin-like MTP4 isoform X1 [Bufo gargarizans]